MYNDRSLEYDLKYVVDNGCVLAYALQWGDAMGSAASIGLTSLHPFKPSTQSAM